MKLYAALLFMLPFAALAQAPNSNEFSVSLQPLHLQQVEQLISGIKSSGIGVMLSPVFQRKTLLGTHQLKLKLGYTSPKTSFEEGATATWLNFALEHSYSRPFAEIGGIEIELGSLLMADYRLGYFPIWDDSHMYWSNAIGAGLATSLNYIVSEKKHYYAKFKMPLVAAISRPHPHRDYKIEDTSAGSILELNHKDLELVTLNRYLNPTAEVGLQLKFSEKFSTAYFYQLGYMRLKASYSETYRELQQSLGIKFTF